MFFRLLKSDSIKQVASIILFLFLVFENSSAQEVLKINSIEQANAHIEDHIYIFKDTTNALDIKQVTDLKKQNHFLPLNKFKERRSFKNTYWLFFSIDNNLEDNYQLGLGFPPIVDHRIDIYSSPDSILQTQTTGFFLDLIENDEIISFSNIVQIEAGEASEFYLKFKNIYNESRGFSIKLINLVEAVKLTNRLMSFDGYALGMMFLMIMYGIFLFFFKKDKFRNSNVQNHLAADGTIRIS